MEKVILRIVGWRYARPEALPELLTPAQAEQRFGAAIYRDTRPQGLSPIFEGSEEVRDIDFQAPAFASFPA